MLRIANLSFGFRHRPLFQDVSLTVRRGELVHLAGPNGAGKSTFMSVVAGLLTAEKGTVDFHPDATATSDGSAANDRRVYSEYLPAEANGLHVKMDAVRNLRFWTTLRGAPATDSAIEGALAHWNLDHPLLRHDFAVEKFSTGMKRRLALARLSLSPAPLWLLDEPVYGLDAQAMSVFSSLLRAHLDKQGLALVVSHDLKPLDGLIARSVTLGGVAR